MPLVSSPCSAPPSLVLAVVGLVVVSSCGGGSAPGAGRAEDLRRRGRPLVADAHRVVDQAATEMERVGAVLDSTESVHATVDSASRLAYRAFANPVVKVLAVRAGAADAAPPAASAPTGARPRHRSRRPTARGRAAWPCRSAPSGWPPARRSEPARRCGPNAGSRRTVQQATARLQPDALVVEVGRVGPPGGAGSRRRPGCATRSRRARGDAAPRGGAVGRSWPPRA